MSHHVEMPPALLDVFDDDPLVLAGGVAGRSMARAGKDSPAWPFPRSPISVLLVQLLNDYLAI